MANDRANSTDYVHPQETNLLNLHKAMQYRADGSPEIRVNSTFSGDIVIEGNVNIPGEVTVNSSPDDPVHVHLTELGTFGNLTTFVPIQGNVTVTGNANVVVVGNISGITTLPAIHGSVDVNNFPSNIRITDLPGITVTNFPSNIRITDGSISVTNFPAFPSNVSITQLPTITGNVNVNNFPSNIRITDMPGITGNVGVSGNVDVTRLPAVTGNVHVYGNVSVDNFPANVSITQMPAVTGNVSVTQGTSPWQVTGNVTINQQADVPNLVKYINTPNNLQMDMTQRLRVSPPTQAWWYAPTVDKDGDLRYIEANVGVNSGGIWVQNLASINMSPGTDSNGSFIRISRRRHKMRPGSSMLAAFSLNWNGYVPDGNVTKRVGVFTNYNGVFYEMTSDLSVVIRRRLTDGTLVEKRVARADFNIDTLDGTGESGYDLRPVVLNTANITAYVSKTAVPVTGDGTIYQVVFTVNDPTQFYVSQKGRITGLTPTLYNGTVMVTAISGNNVTVVYNVDPGSFGSVGSGTFVHTALHNQYVFGFDFNGNRATSLRFFIDGPLGRVAIHQEDFGGQLSTPFANAPAISTRYEIFNTGSPGRLPNFTASSEVINIEAESELNPSFGMASTATASVFNKNTNVGNEYAICGIGLRTGEPYQRADLQVQRIQVVDLGNLNPQNSGIFEWRLVLNPTVSAVPASSNVGKATRFFDYATGTTITGGITLTGGYSQGTFTGEVANALNFLNMGSNIAYTDSDIIVLAVRLRVGGTDNSSVMGMFNFIEAL